MAVAESRPFEFSRVDDAPRPFVGPSEARTLERFPFRLDHDSDRKRVLLREVEVALVVRGYGHDGARAVAREHEVAHPDGDRLARKGVRGGAAREHAFLLDLAFETRASVLAAEPLDGGEGGLGSLGAGHQAVHARVLGGENHEGRPVDRVDSRGEDADGLLSLDRKIDLGARRASHPVLLLEEHAVGPGRELLHVLEELVLVGGDAQEPLLHLTLLDDTLAAPAEPALGLLVRENGLAGRTPVHGRLGPVRDAPLEHLEEEPLVPAVVRRVAGGDLAAPGIAEAEALELPLHARDVVARPLLGVHSPLDRRVLRGQAEGIPADGMQDVHPPKGLVAGDHVGDAVVADVAHVDVARGVGQHLEAVELGLLRVFRDLEGPGFGPVLLPAGLDRLEVVLGHDCARWAKRQS